MLLSVLRERATGSFALHVALPLLKMEDAIACGAGVGNFSVGRQLNMCNNAQAYTEMKQVSMHGVTLVTVAHQLPRQSWQLPEQSYVCVPFQP